MRPTWLKRLVPLCCGVALMSFGMLVRAQVAPAAQTQEQADKQERRFQKQVEGLLVAEQFDDLDQMADGFRREKTRTPGGGWRLREFYGLLDAPQLTDKDSIDHLGHLAAWMTKRPESITARVAMATSMTRWAWVARGNGYANTVSPESFQLFTQRAQVAQRILQESQDLKQKCPQWYSTMMTVGLALNWSERQVKENFERGIQFEPEYFYLYKEYANYLLPKWDGQPGDAARFAKKAADKVGGGRRRFAVLPAGGEPDQARIAQCGFAERQSFGCRLAADSAWIPGDRDEVRDDWQGREPARVLRLYLPRPAGGAGAVCVDRRWLEQRYLEGTELLRPGTGLGRWAGWDQRLIVGAGARG